MSKKVIWWRLFGVIIFISGERIVGGCCLCYFCENSLRRRTFIIAGSIVFGNFVSKTFLIKYCLGNNNDKMIRRFDVKIGDDKLVSGGGIFLQAGHCNLGNGGDVEITGGNTSDPYSFSGKVCIRVGFK